MPIGRVGRVGPDQPPLYPRPMFRALLHALAVRARAVGRRLTPPGNLIPLDESGDERHIDGNHTPSEAGQREHTVDQHGV
jgi:hypothetical protein